MISVLIHYGKIIAICMPNFFNSICKTFVTINKNIQ